MPLPRQHTGMPGTPVIPAKWSQAPRVVIGKTLTAKCTIRRPGGERGDFDPETGTYPTEPYAPHHTGRCRVQVLTGDDQRKVSADQDVTVVGYLVVVDVLAGVSTTATLAIDDLLTVTEYVDCNGDPTLIGRELTVTSIARGSLAWERDLTCVDELQPNET